MAGGYTMTVVNPTGLPLSTPELDGLVTYRPRLESGERVTLRIPASVAKQLQQEPDLKRRHERALEAAVRGPTPRARPEHVDVASGVAVRKSDAGSRPTGRLVADVEGEPLEVDPEDLVGRPGRRGQRFDLASPSDYLGRARRATKRRAPSKPLRCPPRVAGLATTYRSASAAAKTFYNENEDFFDAVPDPWDGLRDWMDGVETRVGRGRARKLHKTRTGQAILGERHAAHAIRRALQYLFGRNKSRRWADVEWSLVQRLGSALENYFEPAGDRPSQRGIYWTPYLGELDAEVIESLRPEQRQRVTACEAQAELREVLEDLKATYRRQRKCMPAKHRRVVLRRIREWSRWAKDPRQIPAYACEPDAATGGMACDYPAVAGELRALRKACADGYDPAWAAELGRHSVAGFPRVNPDAPLRVHYSHGAGILVCGDTRAHKDAIKRIRTRRFRFSRRLPEDCAWYVQRTRGTFVARSVIEAIAGELRGLAGVEIDIDYEDPERDGDAPPPPFSAQEEERTQRSAARAQHLEKRAATRTAESERRLEESRTAAGWEPGQPILVGHHSEGRHRRGLETVQRKTRQAVEAAEEAKRLGRAAQRSRGAAARRQDPDFAMRRIDKLRAELRGLEVKLTGKVPKGWRGLRPPGPATGDYAKQLRLRSAEILSELEHWERQLAETGAKRWRSSDFAPGDVVTKPRSRAPLVVVRVNPKTLTVDAPAPFGDTWDLKLPYANVGAKLGRGGAAWREAMDVYARWVRGRSPQPRGFAKRRKQVDAWLGAKSTPQQKETPMPSDSNTRRIASTLRAGERSALRRVARGEAVTGVVLRGSLEDAGLIQGKPRADQRLTAFGQAVVRELPRDEPDAPSGRPPRAAEPAGVLRGLTRKGDRLPDRKDIAAALRKLIRHHFPGLKISITTPQHSMASTLEVRPRSGKRWTEVERSALGRIFGETISVAGDSASISPWDRAADGGTAVADAFVADFKAVWAGKTLKKTKTRSTAKRAAKVRRRAKTSPDDVSECGTLLNEWRWGAYEPNPGAELSGSGPHPISDRIEHAPDEPGIDDAGASCASLRRRAEATEGTTMAKKKTSKKKTAKRNSKTTAKKKPSKKKKSAKRNPKKTAKKKTAKRNSKTTAKKKPSKKKTTAKRNPKKIAKKTTAKKKTSKKKASKRSAKRSPIPNPSVRVHMNQASERLELARKMLEVAQQAEGKARVEAAMNAYAWGAVSRADALDAIQYPGTAPLAPAVKKSAEEALTRASTVMRNAQRLAGVKKNPVRRKPKATASSAPKNNPTNTAADRARRALSRI